MMLEATNLKVVRRGNAVLSVDRFALEESEFLSLVGPNGSGKSTMILALLRLVPLKNGAIRFKGADAMKIRPAHRYRRNFAAVFQEPHLLNTTVYNNVAQGLIIRGVSRREACRAVMAGLERFGITALKDRDARNLSAGEAQRVSLARAFALNPKIIFLDEPFASLDTPSKELILRDLEAALGESRAAAVMATHDMTDALRLSRTVAVLNGGSILQTGAPEELVRRPVNEFVASFFGSETILTGRVAARFNGSFSVTAGGCDVEVAGEAAAGSEVTFSVRPESIILSREEGRATSARNRFPGRITRIIPAGFYQKVHVDCGFPLVSYITNHSMGEMNLREGDEVYASFKSTAIHVLRVRG